MKNHLSLICLTLCFYMTTQAGEVVESVVAIVNSSIITKNDLKSYCERLKSGTIVDDLLSSKPEDLLKDEKALLKHVIDEHIVDEEVKKQKLSITVERVEQEINSIQSRNGIGREQLRQALKKEGTNFSDYQQFIKKRVERQSVIEKAITSKIKIGEEDVIAAYEAKNKNLSASSFEYKVAHILFRDGKRSDIEQQKRAKEVYDKLKAGGNFEALASQYSEDQNFNEGGFLGSFKTGELVKPMQDALKGLNPGEFSNPAKTAQGYHIIKLIERHVVPDSGFEKQKEKLRSELYQKAFEKTVPLLARSATTGSFRQGKLMLRPLRIGITSGDPTGIGPEVVAKALRKIGPQKNVQFILWRSPGFPKQDLARIKKSFKLVTARNWAEALTKMPSTPKELVDISSNSSPALWVEEAASACFFKHIDAMATGPLSKPTIHASGLRDIGHTDILKRIAHVKHAYMTFIGDKFNVMLATGHHPIQDVGQQITSENLKAAVTAALRLVALLSNIGVKSVQKKPIGVLGLNPHGGDNGLIGLQEQDVIIPTLKSFLESKFLLDGPLVPDAAFMPERWPKYALFLAMYHDQGLIPFKTVHGQGGVHLTWGLPFVRTSVDHGTAFDIAGQDKADATSMRLAIEWAIKLCSGGLKD